MDAMKLLLVDDNSRIRKMMRSIYSPHFDEIIECDDGDKAIAEFNNELFDWVVIDIKMKEMDGIEATEKIISANPEAKVIIVSQYNDETTINAVKKAGAIGFVSKENLYKVIDVINNNNRNKGETL
jgi:two-component system response regulator DegU